MRRMTLGLVAAVASTGAAVGAAPETDTDAQVEKLTKVVASLRQEIEELKAGNRGDQWLTEARADAIRELVQDVLADADTRASLLQGGTAGYDGGFFLGSEDGAFRLKINGQLQVRFVYNHQTDSPTDNDLSGFENRRTKLKFKGHVVDPTWTFNVVGAFADDGGGFTLEDAEIAKSLGGGLEIRVGQFKGPFMREELVSSTSQLLVDRSLVNERWNQDRPQGVEIAWETDDFRIAAMYHDGFKTSDADGSGPNMPWDVEDTEVAVAARAELRFGGEWKQFKDMSSAIGSETALLIGGAIDYEEQEYGTGTNTGLQDLRLTVDASLESDGWNVFGAFVYQQLTGDVIATQNNFGLVVQGGLFVAEPWELFARYEWGHDDTPGTEDLSIITFGFNNYLAEGIKWSSDFGFGLNSVGPEWASGGVGWRADTPGKDGQFVLRSQLQLLF